jgi:hypothetical protein
MIMQSLIKNTANGFFSQIRQIWPKQIISTVLAAFLVLFSTACSSRSVATESLTPSSPTSSNTSNDSYQGKISSGQNTRAQEGFYNANQRFQGGMNNFADDPAYDRDSTKLDAERRVEQAKQNIQRDRVSTPQELIDNVRNHSPLGEKARETQQSLKNSVEENRDFVAKETQKGMRNLKSNTERLKQAVPEVLDEATH